MKAQKLWRLVHHWGSVVVALPLLVMIIAGLMLMLKKDVDWIQPPTQKGVERAAEPVKSIAEIFSIAKTAPGHDFTTWDALSRFDVKPGKGVAKVISDSGYEVQIDTHTGTILSVAQRQSDWLEALHDGSYFADWVKYGLFLPAGLGLLLLWLTGIYLFLLPYLKKAKKHNIPRSRL